MSEEEANDLKAKLLQSYYLLGLAEAERDQLRKDLLAQQEQYATKCVECERLTLEELCLKADLDNLRRMIYENPMGGCY